LQTITPSDLTVSSAKIQTSAVTTAKIADANITAAKLNGAQSGSAPIYAARAWVNFNGTGTIAIRASGNVSSITDNGTGDYTVNFTTALADANYSVTGMVSAEGESGTEKSDIRIRNSTALATTNCRIINEGRFGTYDASQVCASFFR
jgi:hypothetical protein